MPKPNPLGSPTAAEFRRIRDLFESALDQPVASRRAWLHIACDSDSILMQQVERMLTITDGAGHFLDGGRNDHPHAGHAACAACAAPLKATQACCVYCGTPNGALEPTSKGWFRPGTVVAGRYRIVRLEGRGGMGQVYKAHDLQLGQVVALKFLTALRSDLRARTRLRSEVRLARQISHPNICRVFDIGEMDGKLFLSMEHVDGEELGFLLKRIGRPSEVMGLEIARKLCAGLAAAHTKGVLHRDLKPGNVMVDRQGEVRIMDFGLAAATEQQLDASDLRSGTPAYMAPERLAGRHASAASDIYALGLILYEVFTGKPAFEERDAAEMLRLRETGLPTPPSAFVPDIEPSIERTILRCLEPDARLRPVSALAVAAALPGIDPLAAALAVGDTPSPEMVAAASPDVVLQPAAAAALLVFIAVALAGALLLTERTQVTSLVPMQNPPEALAAKARDIVRGAGYDDPDADAAYGFRDERGYLEYGETRVSPLLPGLSEWKKLLGLRPAPVSFWYGQSTRDFVPPIAGVAGAAAPLDSLPAVRAGVSVDLDLDGRLLRFVNPGAGISAQVAPRSGPDWDFFFAAAGLSIEQFSEKASQQQAVNAANRVVWDGSYLGRGDVPVRVEGVKSVDGVISFEVWFPWTSREARYPQAIDYRNAVFFILLWLTPFVVARYNWLRGRGDLRGALRVGAAVCVAELGFLVLSAHHPLTAFVTRPVIWNALGSGAWTAIAYIALEPWVRRWWPHTLIGWARVMSGRWRDPLVARDVLISLAFVLAYRCIYLVAVLAGIDHGASPVAVAGFEALHAEFVLSNLMGPRFIAASIFSAISVGIPTAAISFFILGTCRSLLFNPRIGIAAFCLVSYAGFSLQPGFRADWMSVATYPIFLGLWIFGALRYGLLMIVVGTCLYRLVAQCLLTTDVGAWYGRSSLVTVALVCALANWAFRISIANRSRLSR